MPITKSAKKALRQTKRRTAANQSAKRNYRSAIKEFRQEMSAKSLDKAGNLLPKVYQAVDKAVKKGVIKKNAAARYKSRLTKALSKSK